MFGIGHLFQKIQGTFGKEIMVRNAISGVIKKLTGVEVPIEAISFKNDVMILNKISQSAKSVIFIKKQAILNEISEVQRLKIVKDIR